MGKPTPENLKVIHTSERGAECGRMAKGIPKPAIAFRRQKYCNKRCIYQDRCPAITASLISPTDEKGRHLCFIKTKSKEVQNYFFNLFQSGEEGLIKIVMELYFRLLLKTGQDPKTKDLREAIQTTLSMMESIYGDKQKIEHLGEKTIRIIWDDEPRTNL